MVKRFQFRLQRILQIRKLEENLQKIAFAQAQAKVFDAEFAKKREELSHLQSIKQLAEVRKTRPMPLAECLRIEDLLQTLELNINLKLQEIQKLQKQADEIKEQFLASSRRRKAIDFLRTSQFSHWKKENKKQEAKLFNEIALQRAFWNSANA